MTGQITTIANFASQYVSSRQIDIWQPDAPPADGGYAVLYMHDGQNLFDALPHPDDASRVQWGVDTALSHLLAAGRVVPTIVVGVWNSPTRWSDYMPQKALNEAALDAFTRMAGPPQADNYLRMLVEELKPLIDARYPTRRDAAHTAIMGSSMGGLISLYALCEYPAVFGAAGCVSTHWVAGDGVVVDYVTHALPPAGRHRLYFDYGTEDVDAPYAPWQQRVDAHLAAAGYRPGVDWLTLRHEGEGHHERWWRARLATPLTFLLPHAAQ